MFIFGAAVLLFTALSGEPIYVVKDQIAAVTPATTCQPGAGAKLFVGTVTFCIKETVEESAKRMRGD